MIKKTLFTLMFLALSATTIAQTDYSKVTFRSSMYKYKESKPKTKELGVDKKMLSEIIELLSDTMYSDKQKKDMINKAWLAFTNPKTFDFVYKDFAVKTNKNWSKVNANGEMVLEPNPYLTEWTVNDSEYAYFQFVINKILSHYSLIGHGDDAVAVKSTLKDLLVTKNLNLKDPSDDDWAYSYLENANAELAKKGLVALVTKGQYDIIVCKLNQKEKLTNLFKKMEWELVAP